MPVKVLWLTELRCLTSRRRRSPPWCSLSTKYNIASTYSSRTYHQDAIGAFARIKAVANLQGQYIQHMLTEKHKRRSRKFSLPTKYFLLCSTIWHISTLKKTLWLLNISIPNWSAAPAHLLSATCHTITFPLDAAIVHKLFFVLLIVVVYMVCKDIYLFFISVNFFKKFAHFLFSFFEFAQLIVKLSAP